MMVNKISDTVKKLPQNCTEWARKHPTGASIAFTSIIVVALFCNRNLMPNYFSDQDLVKFAIRAMLTNAVGLFALLTFATDKLSNISKKTKDNTYLGTNVEHFLILQSPHTNIISGNVFKYEIISLFVFPILTFEFPILLCYVTPLWWGIFSTVASLLAWNLVASLGIFGMKELHPESVRSQIKIHRLNRWHHSVRDIITNRGGDAYDTALMHDEYLKEYADIDPNDRNTFKYLTVGNLLPITNIANNLQDISSLKNIDTVEAIYNFIYARQKEFIKHLFDDNNSPIQSLLFDLIYETDLKYRDISLLVDNSLSGSESVVPLTEFSLHNFPPQTEGVELIPAFVYHRISRGISEGHINPPIVELERLIISINNIQNQRIKKYVAEQFVAALVKVRITGKADITQSRDGLPEMPTCLTPEIDPLNEDDIMWKTILASLCEHLLTERCEYSIAVLKTLLKYTSIEFRIAHLFVTLFGNAKMSLPENPELLKYYSQIIARNDLHKFPDSALSGLDSETLAIIDDPKINFERTQKIILEFPLASETFEEVRTGTAFTWLFEVIFKPITYDSYMEFENRNFGSLFDFSTVILWKEMVNKDKDELAFLEIAAGCLVGVFFNGSQNRPNQQDSDKGIDNAKMEVNKAASMLEQLGRTADADRLRQSIDLK